MATTFDATQVIPESEVSIERIRALFDAALYPTEIDSDGDLVIRSAGIRSFIELFTGNRMRILAVFRTEEGAEADALHTATNGFNARLAIVKAFAQANQEGVQRVFFETDLNYDGGLVPLTLIMRFRRFEDIIRRQHELSDLLA